MGEVIRFPLFEQEPIQPKTYDQLMAMTWAALVELTMDHDRRESFKAVSAFYAREPDKADLSGMTELQRIRFDELLDQMGPVQCMK